MEIRALDPDHLEALFDLRTRAFGPGPRESWLAEFRHALDAGQVLGCYDGPRLIASGRVLPFEQWWLGRSVRVGGVAGVYVAPEERGRGVARRLVGALLDRMAGLALSALFPTTTTLYRSVGYEHAGAQNWVELSAEHLRSLAAGPVKVWRAGPGDAGRVTALLRRLYADARDAGPLDRGEDHAVRMLGDESVYSYLADDGYLAWSWADGNTRLVVHRCVAGTEATSRALWAMAGTGSSVVRSVRACVSPRDPVLWLVRERFAEDVCRVPWMLRVLDAEAAVAGRGFPAGLSADVPLVLEDAQQSGNAGAWRLSVAGGRGRLTRCARDLDALRLSASGLAALYAGQPVAYLRRSGLASGGGAAADALLDAAFAAGPYMHDYF